MKKVILYSMLLLCGGLFAQPHIQVVQDATNADFIQHSVVEFQPGRYVVAGTVVPGPVSGGSDILVFMTDDAGNVFWRYYVDYGQDEFVGSLMVDANFNIVLTGYTGTNNGPNKNLILVKLDGNGNYVKDAVITDAGFLGYGGLYGLDIEQTNDGDYLVVGTGVESPTLNASKYAFVMRINNGLNAIAWTRIYRSGTQPIDLTIYDSFNHILKVPAHPNFGETYLLTGSGADPSGNQMVANVLIFPTGNSVWGATGYNGGNTGYPYKGTMALYKNSNNMFYVVHPGSRTQPSVTVLKGNSGVIDAA